MSHKNYSSSFFVLVVTILVVMQSCNEKNIPKTNSWKKTKEERLLTDRYLNIADSLNKALDFKNAYYYYSKAKITAEVKKDTSTVVYSLICLSKMHLYQADYIESEMTATNAIKLLKNRKEHYYNFYLYMILGNIYNNIYDYGNAQYYFEKSLKFKKKLPLEIPNVKNNIASIYIEKKNYKKAVQILESVESKKELKVNEQEYARVICNLGYCYFKLNNPKAKIYLETSLVIRTKINDPGKSLSLMYLSDYYTLKNIKKAQQYASLAYISAKQLNNIEYQLLSLKLLIKLNSGNQSKAYSLKYIELNDSITKIRQMAKNQFAKIKYDSKQEKDENLILKAQKYDTTCELELQKNKNFILIFLSLMGIILTSFLYRFWKLKNKKENLFTAYETETRISKRLHDELANDVYNTMTFAETQDLSIADKKEVLLSQIETIYNRTRNISLENSEIDTSDNFKDRLIMLISGFNNDKINIIINNQDVINWDIIKKSTKITVYRILQELLVNMKKHSGCTLVVIGFETKGKTYEINYSDNGVGSSKKLKFKNGLQNVENRIKTIKGIFTFDTEIQKGFKAKIIFPH